MPFCEHDVSFRNGPQVMVAGLKLRDLGYCRGAHVKVTDPSGNPANSMWQFMVANDEHATLVSRNPQPPAWIQPGVRIRIEVQPPPKGAVFPPPTPPRPMIRVSVEQLSTWRRELIRLLEQIDGTKRTTANEGPGKRIGRLTQEGLIPREVAAFMKIITEMRNAAEYNAKELTAAESEAVSAAWRAIVEWAKSRGLILGRT